MAKNIKPKQKEQKSIKWRKMSIGSISYIGDRTILSTIHPHDMNLRFYNTIRIHGNSSENFEECVVTEIPNETQFVVNGNLNIYDIVNAYIEVEE